MQDEQQGKMGNFKETQQLSKSPWQMCNILPKKNNMSYASEALLCIDEKSFLSMVNAVSLLASW